MVSTDFSIDECDKPYKDLLTESESDNVVEDADRTAALKMLQKPQMFPTVNLFAQKSPCRMKTQNFTWYCKCYLTKIAKEFSKRFKVGKKYDMNVLDLKAKQKMKDQMPKKKKKKVVEES